MLIVIVEILLILLLLMLSAIVSASETAIFSLNREEIQNVKTNSLLMKFLSNPQRTLATILISNNFINICIIILSTITLNTLVQFENLTVKFLVDTVVISALLLIFGEISPKIYANKYHVKTAKIIAPILNIFYYLCKPVAYLLVKSTSLVEKKIAKDNRNLSMEDLSQAINIVAKNNNQLNENNILKGIVRFGDIEVSEIMVSRIDVTAIDKAIPLSGLIQTFVASGHSRIPVFDDTIDNIVGVIHNKDLLPYLNNDDTFNWNELIKKALFIPENKKIDDLLKFFQKQKRHIAVVVDEYGGTSGIITLEDVLEEIVGDIDDEFDRVSNKVVFQKIAHNQWIFEAKTSINDFCKIVDIDMDYFEENRSDAESIGGLILEQTEILPSKNTTIKIHDFDFQILDVDNRHIISIKAIKGAE